MNLAFLKSFPTIIEAEAAQNLLKAHDIEVVFQTERPGMTGYLGNISGGELYVKSQDLEKAKELMESSF